MFSSVVHGVIVATVVPIAVAVLGSQRPGPTRIRVYIYINIEYTKYIKYTKHTKYIKYQLWKFDT